MDVAVAIGHGRLARHEGEVGCREIVGGNRRGREAAEDVGEVPIGLDRAVVLPGKIAVLVEDGGLVCDEEVPDHLFCVERRSRRRQCVAIGRIGEPLANFGELLPTEGIAVTCRVGRLDAGLFENVPCGR